MSTDNIKLTICPESSANLAPESTPEKKECCCSQRAHPQEHTGLISIEDFARVKLLVGQVLEAERLPKSEKLLRFKIDLGEATGPRQILAGIAKYYNPEDLIGRKVVVVANLKPAKLMGQLSEGMLLCASDDLGNLELLSPGTLVAPGSNIR